MRTLTCKQKIWGESKWVVSRQLTTAQVVETSVTVNNSPIQDYVHPDDQTQPTFTITVINDQVAKTKQ